MKIKLGGKGYSISKESIESALRGIEPAAGSKYYIDVAGERFPIRQALAVALGVRQISLSSNHVYQILKKAGFEIIEDGGENE